METTTKKFTIRNVFLRRLALRYHYIRSFHNIQLTKTTSSVVYSIGAKWNTAHKLLRRTLLLLRIVNQYHKLSRKDFTLLNYYIVFVCTFENK